MAFQHKPTLFLDIDGVLKLLGDPEGSRQCMARMARLIEEVGCNVVLSSDWRLIMGPCAIELELRRLGYPCTIPIIGTTPDLREVTDSRGLEICAWLCAQAPHTPTSWAVVDDCSIDRMTGVEGRLVQTNRYEGFTEASYAKLLEKFNV